jgi:hypothetical protein
VLIAKVKKMDHNILNHPKNKKHKQLLEKVVKVQFREKYKKIISKTAKKLLKPLILM